MKIQHDLHIPASCTPIEDYLAAAEARGVETLGFLCPVWDADTPMPDDFYAGQTVASALSRALPASKTVKLLRGCEAELDKNGVLGLSSEAAKRFDFVFAAHSHSQFDGVIAPADRRNPKKLAAVLCDRFSLLVEHPLSGLITAISHPFFPTGNPQDFDEVLFHVPDDRLENLFADAVYKNIALEISAASFLSYPVKSMHRSELFRVYETARECGCKFVFGTGCREAAAYPEFLERLSILARLLEITEAELCSLAK